MVVKKLAKKLLVGLICSTALLGGCGKSLEGQKAIGISQIAEHPALDASREGFISGLEAEGFKDGEKIKIDIQNAQGDIANSQLIAQNFITQKQDMIFAIGTPSAQSAANSTNEIPIFITAVTDAVQAGLVESVEKSGTNVAGTSDAAPIEIQLKLMKTLLPDAKKVGILYNTSEINSEIQVQQVKDLAPNYDLEILAVGVNNTNDISQSLQSIIGDIDVIYALTDNIVASAMPLITTEAMARNIAVIGAEEAHVTAGALATEGINYFDLGFQTGIMAAKVLNGQDISQMPVSALQDMELVINESVAKELGLIIPEEIKVKAKMVEGGQ